MENEENIQNLQVVLRLEEGNGFSFVKESVQICIIATLNGVSLKTSPQLSTVPLQFNTELVWEFDRKVLRELRITNDPVKLECFLHPGGRLGYLTLSIKSAPILSPTDSNTMSTKQWYKLLGINSEARTFHPEILLSLFIEDKALENQLSPTRDVNSISISKIPNQTKMLCENNSPGDLKAHLLKEEGYIQIGPINKCTDTFFMNFFLGSASNLETLLSASEIQTKETYQIKYELINQIIDTQPFIKSPYGNYTLKEKYGLRIRSNIHMLEEYFRDVQPVLQLHLYYGSTLIGVGNFSLEDAIKSQDLKVLKVYDEQELTPVELTEIYMIRPSPDGKFETVIDTNCYVSGGITLKYLVHKGLDNILQGSSEKKIISDIQTMRSETEKAAMSQLKDAMKNMNLRTQFEFNESGDYPLQDALKSPTQHPEPCCSGLYQQPGLETISEENVNACSRIGSVGGILKCGAGDIEDIERQSTSGILSEHVAMKIVHELEDWKEKEQEMFIAKEPDSELPTDFDQILDRFIQQHVQLMNSTQELLYMIKTPIKKWMDDFRREIREYVWKNRSRLLWTAGIVYFLNCNWPSCNQEFLSCLWKLKQKQDQHLGVLSTEWYKKRTEIEMKLTKQIEQCKNLSVALHHSRMAALDAANKNHEIEAQLSNAKEELEHHYNLQYRDLKEAARRLEDDLNHQLTRANIAKSEMCERIKILQEDNERLVAAVQRQRAEFDELRQSSLNKDQTANLLQQLKATDEKLIIAQKSKAFFKDQWARAVREVHRIKSDQQQNINVQIKRNQAHHGLQDFISEHEVESAFDKKELNDIKAELNVIDDNTPTTISLENFYSPTEMKKGRRIMNEIEKQKDITSSSQTETDSDNPETREVLHLFESNHMKQMEYFE